MSAAIAPPYPAETARRHRLRSTAVDPLLTRPEVEAEIGLGRSTIYRLMAAGAFPRPLRIGRQAVRWPRSAIEKWKAEQPLAEAQS